METYGKRSKFNRFITGLLSKTKIKTKKFVPVKRSVSLDGKDESEEEM